MAIVIQKIEDIVEQHKKADFSKLRADYLNRPLVIADRYIDRLFENGITPACERGEYTCVYGFEDPDTATKEIILEVLEKLGYQIERYFDGCAMIRVSWEK